MRFRQLDRFFTTMNRFLSAHDLGPIPEDGNTGMPNVPMPPRPSMIPQKSDNDLIIPYQNYFDYKRTVTVNGEEFSYYQNGEKYQNIAYVCIHGAGFSGLSFAQLAKGLKSEALIICPDLRHHGFSTQNGELDFNTLVSDLNAVIPAILETCDTEGAQQCVKNEESDMPSQSQSIQQKRRWNVVLIGHSLGGSLITAVSDDQLNVLSLVLLDITEGVVMASLPQMQTVLGRRKTQYESVSDFVQCMLRTRTLQSEKAARIEAPGVIDDNFITRANLRETSGFWAGWFRGLNKRFLDSQAWKLLLVSTLEKLDRDHEISMMQGRIAVEVIPGTIHNLHEDAPHLVCFTLLQFLRRLHLTDSLYNTNVDFKNGLTQAEKPPELHEVKKLVE